MATEKKPKRLKIPGEGAWSFAPKDVAEDFDNHVRSQLPWYDFVSRGLEHIARHYVSEGGMVIDVGSSTGNVGRLLAPILKVRKAKIYGVEPSASMNLTLVEKNVGTVYPYVSVWESKAEDVDWEAKEKSDLIVAFLTIMFVRPRERARLLRRMHAALAPGGALVIVDRTALAAGYAAQVLNRLTLAGKVGTGVPADEIVTKELSLSGVQRPIDVADLPGDPVEWFRFGDFAGWVIEA
jgi:tRNA (cmo5U34)-methyltransferase